MVCPNCINPKVVTKCIDSRKTYAGRRVRRVRECPKCGHRIQTLEKVYAEYSEEEKRYVRANTREQFD